jgi:hypothetical protein
MHASVLCLLAYSVAVGKATYSPFATLLARRRFLHEIKPLTP